MSNVPRERRIARYVISPPFSTGWNEYAFSKFFNRIVKRTTAVPSLSKDSPSIVVASSSLNRFIEKEAKRRWEERATRAGRGTGGVEEEGRGGERRGEEGVVEGGWK